VSAVAVVQSTTACAGVIAPSDPIEIRPAVTRAVVLAESLLNNI
jgi:hypothetical protein